MSTESTKAPTAAESLSIVEGREQFIRQCIELFLSAEETKNVPVMEGSPLPDETAYEPRAAKPHERVSEALSVTAQVETAPRSRVDSTRDDPPGQMAGGQPAAPFLLTHWAADPKRGQLSRGEWSRPICLVLFWLIPAMSLMLVGIACKLLIDAGLARTSGTIAPIPAITEVGRTAPERLDASRAGEPVVTASPIVSATQVVGTAPPQQ